MGIILLNKIWFGCKCLSAKRFYNFIFCTHDSLFCHQFNAIFLCVPSPSLPPPKCSPSFVAHQKALGFGIVVSLIRFSYMYCGWIWLDSFCRKSKMPARKIQSVTHKFTDAYKFHSTAVSNQICQNPPPNRIQFGAIFLNDFYECLHKHNAKTKFYSIVYAIQSIQILLKTVCARFFLSRADVNVFRLHEHICATNIPTFDYAFKWICYASGFRVSLNADTAFLLKQIRCFFLFSKEKSKFYLFSAEILRIQIRLKPPFLGIINIFKRNIQLCLQFIFALKYRWILIALFRGTEGLIDSEFQ